MKKWLICFTLFLSQFVIISCGTTKKPDFNPVQTVSTLKETTGQISVNLDKIDTKVDSIKTKIDENSKETDLQNILSNNIFIDNELSNLLQINNDLKRYNAIVITYSNTVENLNQKLTDLKNQNTEAKNEAIKELYSNMKFIFGL